MIIKLKIDSNGPAAKTSNISSVLVHDAARKRAERSEARALGLQSVRLALTTAEAVSLRAKAEREGWGEAFRPGARRALGRTGVRRDLSPAMGATPMAHRKSTAMTIAQHQLAFL